MAKSDKTVKRGVYLYIDGKEIKNDINSIDLEVKRLQRDIKDMTLGSEEYNRTMQKIQHLKGILRDHRNEIRGVNEETKKSTLSVGKLVDGFNRFGGVIVTIIGFLTGVTLALRSFRDERNKLEESQAGLKALTGLDDDSIAWLTRQAKLLSTTMTEEGLRVRQSASEILDAYMLVGSAKPELLGNKEALAAVTEEAMRLQAAAGDIKLSEAVDALTLSLNQYGAAADQAGRFANVLAAGSKEGAANIASQARTIRNAGVAAASANVSIEQTVGLIETLAEKGIKDEVAGTGLKKFFLVLQTGADDINPKIVGLNQALDNLAAKNMGAKAIKDMFGEEGYNVASVIMQDIDKVKQYTAAVTGTNIAYEQAATNSSTAAAALDQARNKMKLAAIELGEKLNPAFTVSTNLATNLLKVLPGLIDWLQEYGMTFVTMLVPVAAYVGYQRLMVGYQKSLNLLMVAGTKAGKLLQGSLYLLQAAFYAVTGQAAKARGAMVAFNLVTNLNPYAAMAAAIAAVGAAFVLLYTRANRYLDVQRALNRLEKEANDSIAEQRSRLETLWKIASNHNVSLQHRKEAMEAINKISPQYLGDITLETINTDKAVKAKDEYIKRLKEEAMLKGAQSHIEEESGRLVELQRQLDEAKAGQEEARKSATYAQTGFTAHDAVVVRLEGQVKRTKKAIESYMNIYKELSNSLGGEDGDGSSPEPSGNDDNPEPDGGSGGADPDKFAAAEAAYYRRIAAIKKQYLDDDRMTQAEYSRQMQDAELALLNDKLRVAGLEPKERQQIADKILDTEIKLRDDLRKQEEKEAEENSKQTSTRLQKQYQLAVESATLQHYQLRTSEEDFYAELRRLQDEYFRQMLDDTAVGEEEKNKIREEMRKRDLEDAKEKMEQEAKARRKQYEEQQRMAEMYVDTVSAASQDLGDALGDLLTAQDDAMKNLWKQLLLTAVNAIEQYIRLTYIKALADSIIGLNFVKALGALAKIAAIETAFAAVKGAIGNFYTGGFTPSGDWNQPQGVVHSNEFVANRYAVANPALRPIFDVIDVAQRSGNVANLTADDIAAVASGSRTASAATSPAPATAAGRPAPSTDPALAALLAECNRTLRRLKQRLDEPITAETYLTGKGGINEAQKEYTKIQNNKSRHRTHD
ncbi:phage tail tape measure protein [uncultured Bacteroides sp.]|uniref:phage tail tape measure protein n=1 Tax=uncultured Bacteroides sp. TaxID=162156 RepID=UPI00260C2473|nr:phage tail tape measure protein [uncultured Bacteroides sp.]